MSVMICERHGSITVNYFNDIYWKPLNGDNKKTRYNDNNRDIKQILKEKGCGGCPKELADIVPNCYLYNLISDEDRPVKLSDEEYELIKRGEIESHNRDEWEIEHPGCVYPSILNYTINQMESPILENTKFSIDCPLVGSLETVCRNYILTQELKKNPLLNIYSWEDMKKYFDKEKFNKFNKKLNNKIREMILEEYA